MLIGTGMVSKYVYCLISGIYQNEARKKGITPVIPYTKISEKNFFELEGLRCGSILTIKVNKKYIAVTGTTCALLISTPNKKNIEK